MKKFVMSVAAAATLCGSSALAADMPMKAPRPVAAPVSPWDWAFGGALMSDYNFRGISQSNKGPSVTAYSETRYNATSNVQFCAEPVLGGDHADRPERGRHLRRVRLAFDPLTFDFGAMYYWYPRERNMPLALLGAFPIRRQLDAGPDRLLGSLRQGRLGRGQGPVRARASVSTAPSWLNTGASGCYASATAKLALPSPRPASA
jgi:hypothetical protein